MLDATSSPGGFISWQLRLVYPGGMIALRLAAMLLLLAGFPRQAVAADMPESGPPAAAGPAYGNGLETWRARRGVSRCPLYQPLYSIPIVATNDVCDPTYVGSSMGLSRPSYYGTLPPPGYDAP
jgi:hypothetical protein